MLRGGLIFVRGGLILVRRGLKIVRKSLIYADWSYYCVLYYGADTGGESRINIFECDTK